MTATTCTNAHEWGVARLTGGHLTVYRLDPPHVHACITNASVVGVTSITRSYEGGGSREAPLHRYLTLILQCCGMAAVAIPTMLGSRLHELRGVRWTPSRVERVLSTGSVRAKLAAKTDTTQPMLMLEDLGQWRRPAQTGSS